MSALRGMGETSWTRIYRLVLCLLPPALRRKHGPAMEALFARELGRARARGRLHGALAGATGVCDVVRRGVYERMRAERDSGEARHAHPSPERWALDAHRSRLADPRAESPRAGGPPVPPLSARELLRRHAVSFAAALVALTVPLLALFATRRVPALSARGAPVGTIAEALVLAVPFTAAMTIPIAVLVAVLREFTRLRADGTLAATRRRHGGLVRLVGPVLAAAVALSALTLGWNTAVLPRANARLAAVLAGHAEGLSDRAMTVAQLRAAARVARADARPDARSRAAVYEVEVQKKYALAAACVVLALAGVVIPLGAPHGLIPRSRAALVIGASGAVVGTYYVLIVTGEDLADRLVVPPMVGMWGANALVLAAALLVAWRRGAAIAPYRSS